MSWLRPIDHWFGEHVFPHRARHRAYALRLTGNEHDAEDLVQEAYARLFKLASWRDIANPHAFTTRIIHNEAIERFRRAGVVRIEQGAVQAALDPADDAPGPDAIAAGRSDLARIARAIADLPDRCGEAFRLRRVEGLSPADVADRMQISVSTVEKHVAKGLRLLHDVLSGPCDTGPDVGEWEQSAGWSQRKTDAGH